MIQPNAPSAYAGPYSEAETPSQAALSKPWLRYTLALLYSIIMVVLYQSLSEYWAYLGFTYEWPGAIIFPIVLIAATPSFLLAPHPKTFTQFASWLLFYILFMPATIIPHLQGWIDGFDAAALFLLTVASTFIFLAISRRGSVPFPHFHLPSDLFWIGLLGAWGVFHGAIYVVLGDTLQLAGLGQAVYDQRQEASSQVTGLILYIVTNASGAINPVLVAIGFAERKWWAVGLGIVGQVLVYMTLAGKIVLVFPIIIIGTFFLFRRGVMQPNRIALAMAAIALIGLPLQLGREQFGDISANLVDLVYMRTLYLPGVLVGAYHDFFSIYPLTYFSHSIVGRFITEYPYGIWSVGQVVGNYITPGIGYNFNNYNANFIASDGVASFGMFGIPVVVVAAAFVLRLIDRILGHVDIRVRCAALVPFVMWIADGSLTTAMLTGGGILATFLLWVYGSTRHHVMLDREDITSG